MLIRTCETRLAFPTKTFFALWGVYEGVTPWGHTFKVVLSLSVFKFKLFFCETKGGEKGKIPRSKMEEGHTERTFLVEETCGVGVGGGK